MQDTTPLNNGRLHREPWGLPVPSNFPMDRKEVTVTLGELLSLLQQAHYWEVQAGRLRLELDALRRKDSPDRSE